LRHKRQRPDALSGAYKSAFSRAHPPSFIPRNSDRAAVKFRFLFCPFFFVKKFSGKKAHIKKIHMQPFSIKCFRSETGYPPSSFFILSKGRHTGRPSFSPNPNCFVFSCAPEDLQRYYWMVYSLWATGAFLPYLIGSVIEFIHIHDLKTIITKTAAQLPKLGKEIESLQRLLLLEAKLKKQLNLIQRGRRSLCFRFYRVAS
jgi:hypothetical protein